MKRVIARTRRGVILLTCLIVITLGALVGTTILYFSGAEQQAAEVGFRSVQSRAMAWSGVQAVMAELDSQREEILQGAAPELTQSWLARSEEAGTQGAGLRWGYRLLLLGEVSAEPQAARLDVNTATPEMLARLSGVSKELAAAIVTARKTRRFTSVSDLLSVPGMTSELLFEVAPGAPAAGAEEGPEAGAPVKAPERGSPESDEPAEEAATTGAEDAETAPPPRTRPLAEFLTAFSFDPEVQLGYGAKASEVRGNQRINLNVEWTDALGEAIERRFDKGVADGVRGLLAQGRTFEKPSDIVKTMREFRIKPTEWSEVLDAFTTTGDEYRIGMVDLNTAPVEVLACIPGVTREAAADIVFRRGRLDEEMRRTVAWPAIEGVLSEDDFEKAVDHLSTRCLQWRVVIEAGVLPGSEDGAGEGAFAEQVQWEGSGNEEGGAMDAAEFTRAVDGRGPSLVSDRVVLEAVIDISSRRPRVALLRDASYLPIAARLSAAARRGTESSRAKDNEQSPAAETAAAAGAAASSGATESGAESDGHELDLGGLESNELVMDDEGDDETSGEADAPAARAPVAGGEASVDRRVGRWTTNAAGGNR